MTRAAPTIGERGRRFTLELPLESPDGFGGVLVSYEAGPRLWGAIEMLSAVERVRADRPEGVATHRVTLLFRDGITDAMRLALGVRRFRIKVAGDPDGRRRHVVCLVEEVGA